MKITLDDLKKYDTASYYFNAPGYLNVFGIVQSGADSKDAYELARKMRRIFAEYEGLSFLVVLSTTDSKTARKEKIHTGKRGRPKTVVKGKADEGHIHGLVVNTNPNIKRKTMNKVKKEIGAYCRCRRNKRPKLKQHKIQALDELFIVKYVDKQADVIHRGGDFDFNYFMDKDYVCFE